jgi:mannose-6-phosphate isomerase-like protein (cupin superfamily)
MSGSCASDVLWVGCPTVRLRRAPTRRAILSAVGQTWIVSPRTGAGLKRDAPQSENELRSSLAVLRLLKPGMGRFPTHVHVDFAERFEVKSGAAQAEFDGDKLRLTAEKSRSTLYVPPGVPHVNPYNDEREDLELRQSFMPVTEGARSYVETLAAVLSDGRDNDGELPWSLMLAVADVTGERTYLTPVVRRARRADAWSFALQRRVLLPVGTLVAGMRDYDIHLEPETEYDAAPAPRRDYSHDRGWHPKWRDYSNARGWHKPGRPVVRSPPWRDPWPSGPSGAVGEVEVAPRAGRKRP